MSVLFTPIIFVQALQNKRLKRPFILMRFYVVIDYTHVVTILNKNLEE